MTCHREPSAYEQLEPKQRAFVDAYCVTWNAADAARKAGYSAKNAREQGHDNLTKPHIEAAIRERMTAAAADAQVTAARVIRELAAIAFASPLSVATWDAYGVKLKESCELTEEQAAALESVTHIKGEKISFKLQPKMPALKELADRLGIDKAAIEALNAPAPAGSKEAIKARLLVLMKDAQADVKRAKAAGEQ